MRVSTIYDFTFLCMPKCASTSIEKALNPYSQLSTSQHPKLKHTNYKKYAKFIKPFVDKNEIEVVCLMREPISWLHSWYRYRGRPEIKNSQNYCGNMTFDEWIIEYLSDKTTPRTNVGVQNTFFKDRNGHVGVNKVFKFENLDDIKKFFEKKIGKSLNIPTLNKSPKMDFELSEKNTKMLEAKLHEDYKIYNSL